MIDAGCKGFPALPGSTYYDRRLIHLLPVLAQAGTRDFQVGCPLGLTIQGPSASLQDSYHLAGTGSMPQKFG
jgi:hypothetical protein